MWQIGFDAVVHHTAESGYALALHWQQDSYLACSLHCLQCNN